MATLAVVRDMKKNVEVTGEPVAIANRTLCLVYSFGLPGNSKKLKESQFSALDADKKMIHANKVLLDSKELKAIANADGELRTFLDTYCLPHPNRAVKIVPYEKVVEIADVCDRYQERRENELIPAFIDAYPRLCEQAEKRLGKVYNPADYPDKKYMLSKFRFRYQFLNFGTVPAELRELKRELYRNEQKKAREVMAEAAEGIIQVRRAMFLKLVEHLKDKLTPDADGKEKIFRDTAVTKLQEFVDSFDVYNVANDEEGAALAAKIRELVSGINPDQLRTSEGFKEKVLKAVGKVSGELGNLVVEKPSRKFRLVKG
jgi:hypothetical protein